MIKLENIEKSFDDKKVIKDFSLHIKDNEFIVLTGKSGSGKTTLLNILGLLENPDQGSIQIDNKESFVLCVSRTTCSHCQSYKPKLQKVANKYNIKIYYTDIDTYNKDELNDFNSRITFDGGTPVTLFIKNGEEKTTATRIIGDVSSEKIIDKLKKNDFIK